MIRLLLIPLALCPTIQWSREHVVPKSIIRVPNIANDPGNIIQLPRRLNNARSSLKYVDELTGSYKDVFPCTECPFGWQCDMKGHVSRLGFVPPDSFKGPVGRSALYMADRYPEYRSLIDEKVIDLNLAIEWSEVS